MPQMEHAARPHEITPEVMCSKMVDSPIKVFVIDRHANLEEAATIAAY